MSIFNRLQNVLSRDDGEKRASPGDQPSDGATKPLPEGAIAIIPMRNTVLFPGVIAPVTIGREGSIAAAQDAVKREHMVGFLLQRESTQDKPGPTDLHWVGTAGRVVRYVTGTEGAHHMVAQGEKRFRVLEFIDGYPFLAARVLFFDERVVGDAPRRPEIEARFMRLKEQAVEAMELLPNAPAELTAVIQGMETPPLLADMVANILDIKPEEKQTVLETFSLQQRLDKVLLYLAQRIEVLRLSREISEKTKKEFDERQREHVL
ncbi:MAG: LON peptidase substrate-binding domain-containing protein, partial [Betaproteobacteria bacterium]|nr:LON peptidase substrate-binding domain-containing protein [Betaproteobacteria bacterium]